MSKLKAWGKSLVWLLAFSFGGYFATVSVLPDPKELEKKYGARPIRAKRQKKDILAEQESKKSDNK